MLTPRFIGRLRRAGLWSLGKRAHSKLAPPLCAAIHAVVTRSSSSVVPQDLALKHVYDYRVVFVDPALIDHALHVGAWRGPATGPRTSALARFWSWFELGGGWKSARRHLTRNLHGRFIANGDWDAAVRPLRHRHVIAELFIEGREPEQTREYQKLRRRIESGDFAFTHGCMSISELDDYFAQLIKAFEAIRTEGYKTQEELGLDGSDEVRVCIDRHGRLSILSGGTHRLTMARVLGLDRIPVLIKRVHTRWVDDCIARSGAKERAPAIAFGVAELEAATHPDRGAAGEPREQTGTL